MCTDFKFEAHEKIAIPFKDIKIKVFRKKLIQRQGTEIHCRFARGSKREGYSKDLLINKPSVVRTMKIQEVPLTILESGNRDDAPSLPILQEISSQYETQQDLSRHPLVHLERLARKYREDPKWKESPVSGYVQERVSIIAFTEKQILYLLSLDPKNHVFCYLENAQF